MCHDRPHDPNVRRSVAVMLGFLLLATAARADVTLSDNLGQPSAGTEAATGSNWVAASFGTDGSSYNLTSVTLLMSSATTGSVVLDLYSDGGYVPGSLLGVLTAPATVSSTLAAITFTARNLTLAANSTYWVVLSAPSGEYDWSYTASDTGTGVTQGFQDSWASSSDAGQTWFGFNSAPTQMTVSASLSTAAVPEPGTFALGSVALVGLAIGHRLRRRAAASR